MTNTATHSPAPWSYEYSPYTHQAAGAAGEELPAFEIFDAEGNKLFDTNEDAAAELQDANARLASAAPELLAACRMVIARWERGDLAEAARACQAAVSLVTAGGVGYPLSG